MLLFGVTIQKSWLLVKGTPKEGGFALGFLLRLHGLHNESTFLANTRTTRNQPPKEELCYSYPQKCCAAMQDEGGDEVDVCVLCFATSTPPHFVVNAQKILECIDPHTFGDQTIHEAQDIFHLLGKLDWQIWCCVVCSAGMVFGLICFEW